MGDRFNYGSSEFRGTCAVAPKSEQQTMNLDRRLSSLKLCVNINAGYVDLRILLNPVVGVDGYEVGTFVELIHDHPN
jgi:hypothetical protein